MRGVFSVLGLLLAVVIVGLLVRKQFAASPVPLMPGAETSLPVSPAQQSHQIQERFKQDLDRVLQQPRLPADQ